MAKINHNNSLDTIDELFTDAKNRGIMHLQSDLEKSSDRKMFIEGNELVNFGTCGYLGLELDQRLKDAGSEYVQKYGTQFSVSRAFVSSGTNEKLEEYLSKMYDNSPVIVYSSTSTAHISVIPTLVKYDHAIILDQQVHMSVQTAAQLLRQKGVPIEMIRHSNLEMLERVCEPLCRKHDKVWYMIDGVYSMFGDVAPMEDLLELLDKYPQLHLYIDDAHGMGWCGKNGTGYAFSKAGKHPRVVYVNTLAKGFGVMGGLAIFPDAETCRKVKIFGGPLAYSHPLPPAIIGSAIASAKIHLSEEIDEMQKELQENIRYCNELLSKTDLVVASNPLTPIYLIGMGQPKVGYNMVNRILKEGFFVNPAIFPAVSVKNTGLRFTITRHVKKADIKALVDALVHHFPKVLAEENCSIEKVRKAFNVKKKEAKIPAIQFEMSKDLYVEEYKSIQEIDRVEWNSLLGENGSFDWEGLRSLEDVFSGNEFPEENWKFYYFIVRNTRREVVFATFFTSTIYKDDMLSLESVSLQVEEERKYNPYYLTSQTLAMGSLLTEGRHYYIDKNNPQWKKAVVKVLDRASAIQESIKANTIILRDFDKEDDDFRSMFHSEGFVSVDMPNSNTLHGLNWNTKDELLNTVSARNRRHIRKDVFDFEHVYDVTVKDKLSKEETSHFYDLYRNVEGSNRGFNMFFYPSNILEKLSKHKNWEFIVINLKPDYDKQEKKNAVAAIWCHKQKNSYSPMIIGMNYEYLYEFKLYKQAMYQVVKRARDLGMKKVYLGLSADTEKRKFGAKLTERVAYVQMKDNYNANVLEAMSASNPFHNA